MVLKIKKREHLANCAYFFVKAKIFEVAVTIKKILPVIYYHYVNYHKSILKVL